MVIKYALIGVMVALGIFAYAQREFVTDAFHWNPKTEPLTIPAFDPVARTKELATPPATQDVLQVAKAADTRDAGLVGTPPEESATGIEMQGGSSALLGTVTGPSGPVAGATVRIERFVGEASNLVDVSTDRAGAFAFENAPGGRYRVRAWRAPALAQLSSEVVFVSEGERHNFSLQLDAPGGRSVNVDPGGSGWTLGGSPTITIGVNEPYVTRDGKVALTGTPGLPTNLTVTGALAGGGPGSTNSSGNSSFTVRCVSVGPSAAMIAVGSYTRWVDVPACAPPPTTTTTTAPPPTQPGQPAPSPPATAAPARVGE